jgi:hypothetical protein
MQRAWKTDVYRRLVGKPKGKILGDIDVGGRLVLKCILWMYCWCCLDSSGSVYGRLAVLSEHGNNPFDSINDGEFLD